MEPILLPLKTVDELKDYMGEVIQADLSNLSSIYDAYDIDQETLIALLEQNGKSINDFIYVYDLNVIAYSGSEDTPVIDEATLAELLKMMDLDETEMKNLENYFASMEDYYASPAFITGISSLFEHLSAAMEGMNPNAEITKAQARQITAYLNELFELMKLKIEISAYVNGREVSFPISDLLRMTEFNDTIDKIKLSFYGENNVFLADYYMSQDIIDYLTGKPSEIREEIEEIVDQKPAVQKPALPKTEDGGKLPKTSTNYIPGAILGGLLAVAGVLMYQRIKMIRKKPQNKLRKKKFHQLTRIIAVLTVAAGLWLAAFNLYHYSRGYLAGWIYTATGGNAWEKASREWNQDVSSVPGKLPISTKLSASEDDMDTNSLEAAEPVLYEKRPQTGEQFGELFIPKLDALLPIYEGTGEDELDLGVGHYAGSVLPGEKDNCVLSGHRDTVFRRLGEVGEGDALIVRTEMGEFKYVIKKVRIVDKEDRTVIVSKPKAVLTVSTCYPFEYIGSAPQRYILVAYLSSTSLNE